MDHGDDRSWDRFKDDWQHGKSAYEELKTLLPERQRHLCAYCEIQISAANRQIEHFQPRDDATGPNRTLDYRNMLGCCLGGTDPQTRRENRVEPRLNPMQEITSCGQLKGSRRPGEAGIIDPRTLQPTHMIWEVSVDGEISPKHVACQFAGVHTNQATSTIAALGLNCRRLRNLRKGVWEGLSKAYGGRWEEGIPIAEMLEVAVEDEGQIAPFFTTIWSYFGPDLHERLSGDATSWV